MTVVSLQLDDSKLMTRVARRCHWVVVHTLLADKKQKAAHYDSFWHYQFKQALKMVNRIIKELRLKLASAKKWPVQSGRGRVSKEFGFKIYILQCNATIHTRYKIINGLGRAVFD